MLIVIPGVLTKDQVSRSLQALHAADWVDGKVTAGVQSGAVKQNMQLPEGSPVAQQLGDALMSVLSNTPAFIAAALPAKVYPPLFNRYQGGEAFGNHVDNAIRPIRGTPHKVRTDLSVTLFLTEPEDYDGGELVIEDTYGSKTVKLPAGDMVLYPSTSLHHVTPVTRGARIASFFWIQSMVRSDEKRRLLHDMDRAIQTLAAELGQTHDAVVTLTGNYHNLLRMWAEV
ncbi:MAG: Fe2+-dependent dioxygenase [Sphingomonadales bacterium]